MSAIGTRRTSSSAPHMSASRGSEQDIALCRCTCLLWPKADILLALTNVRIAIRQDAQLLLDVGHHRVRQARLAEFREVLNDDALP